MLLSETEQRKVAWYTFSIAVAAMYRRDGVIASWIPSIYILSQNMSLCLWKQCQQPRNKCSPFVNQHCFLYWKQQSISVLQPARNLCTFVKCGQKVNLNYCRKHNLSFRIVAPRQSIHLFTCPSNVFSLGERKIKANFPWFPVSALWLYESRIKLGDNYSKGGL